MASDIGIKFVHINVRSLFRKVKQLELLYYDMDFLYCSETWLDNRYNDNMVKITDMKMFRCDRQNNINSYSIKNIGGGVCIYVGKKFKDFACAWKLGTEVTQDYEISTVLISKPKFRNLALVCVYKPPKGKISKLVEFLKTIMSHPDLKKREIWILGDFNVDWLKRDAHDTIALKALCKNYGLTQYMDRITRPNKKGGSCIDLVMTNSNFVKEYGILDDVISDHYTVFCIRKKAREMKEMVSRVVRNYKNYNENVFIQLVRNLDWTEFDNCLDPNKQWLFIREKLTGILSVMCPYKHVNSRKYKPLWITPDIYRSIRERKRMFKLYRQT